jgi:peptidoglycan/LPS O-acetylase OafA/YrhL
MPRLDSLTGLRFWFAFLVVLHHSLVHWFGNGAYVLSDFGYIGVDFFFVLSGFVLTWSWRPDLRAARFWWHRFSRIWPLHLTTLVLALTVATVGIVRPDAWGAVANVLLLQAWSPDVHTFFGFNSVSWSLSCEVFFYACFPVLVRRIARLDQRGRCWLVGVVTALLCVYPGAFSLTVAPRDFAGWEWTTYVLPLWRLGEFVVGIAAALALRDGWRPPFTGRSALRVAAGLSAALLAVGIVVGHLPVRPPVEIAGMLVVAAVIVAVAHDELLGRKGVLSSRVMVELGSASYALYLCHALVFAWLTSRWHWIGTNGLQVVGWSVYALAAGLTALALHHFIEAPCERWLRRRTWPQMSVTRRRQAVVLPYPVDDDEREPALTR